MTAEYGELTRLNSTMGVHTHDFQLTFAPLLFGVLLNVMLFGVFLVQVHSYFRLYKTDNWIRYIIYYLMILEVVNTVCDIGLIYEPLIVLHDTHNVPAPALQAADPIVTTLISTPTQLFMAWRVRLVTKSRWPSTLVALLASTSLAGGMASTILLSRSHQSEFGLKSAGVETAMTFWLTSTAFADLFVTMFLVNFLWKSKTGFQTQTDSVTDKIIFLTVQTGAITSVAAIADVATFLIVPNTTINFIWDFSLSKMYSICLISTLNARAEWNSLAIAPSRPTTTEDPERKAIIRVRRATDIEGLQLYIPNQFAFNSHSPSPRIRAPREEWIPPPLPPLTKSGEVSRKGSDQSDIMQRTAEWVRKTGR